MSRSIWSTLGIAATNDVDEIRRAYARRLKQVHPEDDPQGFQALRAAYDQASNMARNGWAVPPPMSEADVADDYDDTAMIVGGWPQAATGVWPVAPDGGSPRGWAPPEGDRWTRPEPADQAVAEAGLPEDIRAELARERNLAETHQALCDQLMAVIANPEGDRHEALSALIRIFRSPAMDSLTTHARTEQWLAHVIAFGEPIVDDLIEPAIQFFGWDSRRVGVDLSHAEPVLRRRETGVIINRLERGDDPDHAIWRALKRKPTRRNRLSDRLTPKFANRVDALLYRLDFEAPEALDRLNPETVELWRSRLARPVLGPIYLWCLLLAPPVVAFFVNIAGDFGPPTLQTFLAVWTVVGSALFALGVGSLHAVTRPRLAWRSGNAWSYPLWVRFGWAPAALLLPVAGAALPPAPWLPLLVIPVAGGLWIWARITTSHIHSPYGVPKDWGRYAGLAPITGYVLMQAGLLGGAALTLQVAFAGAAIVLQTGGEAIADEVSHWMTAVRRRVAVALLATVAVVGAAAFASANAGFGIAAVCGVVTALALADRALAWNRVDQFVVPRRFVLLIGWIGGLVVASFMPFGDFDRQVFTGLSFWLLAAAALTALDALFEGTPLFSRRKGKRTPGELA